MRTDPQQAPPLPDASGLRFAVIVSRFNEEVTRSLRRGAEGALTAAGASGSSVEYFDVPGAFELPVAARLAASSSRFDAVVCLGCVIRGETPHFEYISSAVAHALADVSVRTGLPVAFGVLTTDTIEQARARAAEGPSNKGWEAASAAIEMARLVRRIDRRPAGGDGVRV
jgi:6,7-dimethyl-8-ribityllumazine synthase